MANGENKSAQEKRKEKERRQLEDRRTEVRFNDELGRRTGIERRLEVS